ncbi:MAG: NAD(P)H-hydrate dehydratase [Verrucomicrobiae bacterium]|nr:NAD(P)H-hydrate dehydratase [Verrucomicrobiae bacterium]
MPLPVITVAQMREWESASWAAGRSEADVIRQVGRAVAERARALTSPSDRILILAGKGNNGADARAAAEHLADRRVEVLNITVPDADLPALDQALARKPALVVDGLFGIGLNRPLDVPWTRLIQRVNGARCRVLAVDVPSGLNADTGETYGAAIEAALTLTVGAPKHGLLLSGAWPFVGRLEVTGDVGLVPCPLRAELNWTLPEDFDGFPPARAAAAHKGSFGHLAILAGSLGYHGAAVLAARGAQRAQPGLITVLPHEAAYHPIAAQLQAVMVRPWEATVKLPGDFSALLIGPGLAAPDIPEEMKATTRRLWRDVLIPIVVDASALDWLPLDPTPRGAVRVITPHPGEAARLLKTTPARIQANRLAALRELSLRFGNTWVVLKGHQTLVGRNEGEVFVNPTGNPHMAQGGSGDVLAGFIAGLLAQPELQKDPLRTLRYAVWRHGHAADVLSGWAAGASRPARAGWVVEDLLTQLGD